ncbi:MAG: hypothetical protein CL843_06540 [Crocinitomicaceae bacterium]|nr:hypothetical protein [Crocinitomicaceae bacterium]|tara:strand:- start:333 stop:761 length:429 start_codon:yes stop_codon:yes gene_type:complete
MHKDELGLDLTITLRAIGSRIIKEIRNQGIELPGEQIHVLEVLATNKSLIQQELSDLLHKDKSAVLRIIDSLEKKGLVVRVPDETDRRKKNIVITNKGIALRDQIKGIGRKVITLNVFKDFSDEQLTAFDTFLKMIRSNLTE